MSKTIGCGLFALLAVFVLAVSVQAEGFEVIEKFNYVQDENLDIKARAQETTERNADFFEKILNIDDETIGVLRSSAPPVSYLEFTGVLSTNWPWWEDIQANQFATIRDHGGTIYLEVLEIGYGYNYAWLSGAQLPEVGKFNVVNGFGIVVGFVHYYEASAVQGGYATTQARSINYQYNMMDDALNVL